MKKRFLEVDFLRGAAVILMVAFHVLFTLNFMGKIEVDLSAVGFLVLARVVQFTFLGLVGVSLSLVWQRCKNDGRRKIDFLVRQLKRGVVVIGLGYLVTMASLLVVPEFFVKWGVLHCIGLGIIFFSWLAGYGWWSLFVAVIFALGGIVLPPLLEGVSNYPLYVLGLAQWGGGALDYFPVFPWFAVIGGGVFLGNMVYKNFEHRWGWMERISESEILQKAWGRPIIWCGQNALVIYVGHIPLLGLIAII